MNNSPAHFDFQSFQQSIMAATRTAFMEISAKNVNDPIQAFALYTDDDAITVCPSSAPRSYFERLTTEEADDTAYYRFSPAEWPFEAQGANSAFNALSSELWTHQSRLWAQQEAASEDNLNSFKQQLLHCCETSLQALRAEGLFGNDPNFLLVIAISDDDEPASACVPRMARLNAPNIANAFAAWASTWAD